MPREKKIRPTKRKDGRYVCRYKGQYFYSSDPDDCIAQREQFKELERRGRIMPYFVTEYALKWLDNAYPNANPRTRANVKTHVEKLNNAIGSLPVSDVRPSDIKTIYATHYADLSNDYIKQAKRVFCAVFDSAVADGLIPSNPARDRTAKPHKGKIGGHRSITQQEREWMLTKATNHRMFPVAMLMLYAGLRPQEAKAFNIDRDVDFVHDIVTVRQTAHVDRNNVQKYVFSDTGKTAKANRHIPLLPPLKAALTGKHGHIITQKNGNQITRISFDEAWASYCNQIEREINGMTFGWYGKTAEHKRLIAEGKPLPPWVSFRVTPYDLRHSFATMCRDLKPPVELHTVIKWMGHTDAKMILQIYDSVTDERDKAEGDRLRESLTTELTTKPCIKTS